ncbi:alanine:cation symporter family protein [Aquimarina sp. AD10]|uniref:alanine/glycine:cation symporter family protein n=1 Tax=Aquimarina sp. AD10 TaxID=1714849 RepID=UPI000E51F55B|nr:alanine/glycine:cation symporter family protein [Aquimarina sp. AD10]AXT63255.1 alanine:cation symporter family protein [Aquimarina sp. AD10]RKN00732.1 amino acid carrier protein [Aquimarina sp. AD10]
MLLPCIISQQNLDENINQMFGNATGWFVDAMFAEIPITSSVGIPWVAVVLLLGASYFTVYFKFINFRSFYTAFQVVRGKYDVLEDKIKAQDEVKDTNDIGEVSHFQALTTAVSATVGLGNIAGVAIALSIGGPGATFWMVVIGVLGMSSKFVECTLGVKYREIDENGRVFGGPMYYLTKGLKEKGYVRLGKVLSIFFAIMCIGGSFGGGNMFQVNQAFKLFDHVIVSENSMIHGQGWVFGLIMAILVGVVIIGGIKKIASVTDKIVPFMVLTYIVTVFTVLILFRAEIPKALIAIWEGVFYPQGVIGGFVGVLVQGLRRGAFSNEAGVGSASIAHSAVKTRFPASEGLVALLEPFIDTVIVCTMTALVLIITGQISTGVAINDEQGVLLTASALQSGVSWFPYLLTIAVMLFAFSSMISWSYYGYQAWSYLFGRGKQTEYVYKSIFCCFTVIGAAATLNSVTDFSDAMIFAMMVPNMIGLFLLSSKVKEELIGYKQNISNLTK